LDTATPQFPPDAVLNDALSRDFDATSEGIDLLFNRVAVDGGSGDSQIDRDGFFDALVNHFGFVHGVEREAALAIPEFQRLAELVGFPCNRESFGHVVRRLRMGKLLSTDACTEARLLYYDYDEQSISGSFVPSRSTRQVWYGGNAYVVPNVEKQIEMGETPNVYNFAEYIFENKFERVGRVHWLHAHRACKEVILALGQFYRMPAHIQSMVCSLSTAESQMKVHDKDANEQDGLYTWSSVIVPAVYLESESQRSMQRYDAWFKEFGKNDLGDNSPPPRVKLGAIVMKFALLWSNLEANTLVSVSSEPVYLGKWLTDRHTSFRDKWSRAQARFMAWLQALWRREKSYDYQALCEDDVLDKAETGEAWSACGRSGDLTDDCGAEVDDIGWQTAGEEERSTFEAMFQQVLQQLDDERSLLRMGTGTQLVSRIVLNRTEGYLQVVSMYKAAIHRCQFLLRAKTQANKDELISKISLAKLELSQLLRLIQPFVDNVLGDFEELGRERGSTHQHVVDIRHNLRHFVPQCKSQIELCESLIAEYDRAAGDRVNNILNILTVITFVVMPVQLLTGMYGMNFKKMPELHWDYGYYYFFALASVLTVCFSIALVCIYRVAT